MSRVFLVPPEQLSAFLDVLFQLPARHLQFGPVAVNVEAEFADVFGHPATAPEGVVICRCTVTYGFPSLAKF